MSRRIYLSIYDHEEDILNVARAARTEGLTIVDIFTPYAVHGLQEAAGFSPSKLPLVCFVLGLSGAVFKVWFEYWTTAVNWPIDIGGKPWNSLPAFVPITFEVMVLVAGVGTVIALFITCRLYPGRKPKIPFHGVTDDRFALLLEESDATFDPGHVKRLCERFNATHIEEYEEEVA